MKTNKMLIIVTALVFALVLSTAGASENKGMCGTWVNAKYFSAGSYAPKLIIMEDGTTEAYPQLSATQRCWHGSYAVFEYVLDYKDYPSELKPANLTYRRYTRQ